MGGGGGRWGEVGKGGERWGEVGRGGKRWGEVGRRRRGDVASRPYKKDRTLIVALVFANKLSYLCC